MLMSRRDSRGIAAESSTWIKTPSRRNSRGIAAFIKSIRNYFLKDSQKYNFKGFYKKR